MTKLDLIFWVSVLISTIYGVHDKVWQQVLWCLFAFAVLIFQMQQGVPGV